MSTFGGPYYLLGVYFLWSVLSTRCLLSVSILRASTFRLPSRSRCLLSVVRSIYSVSTFSDPHYLLRFLVSQDLHYTFSRVHESTGLRVHERPDPRL